MAKNEFRGMTVRNGTLRPKRIKFLPATDGGRHVSSRALTAVSKGEIRIKRLVIPGASATAVADSERPVHIALARGHVHLFAASVKTLAIGDATCAVKLYKNGVLVTGSTVTLDSGDAAMESVAASITTENAAYVEGDQFSITVDATAGTGTLATGLIVSLVMDEKPR